MSLSLVWLLAIIPLILYLYIRRNDKLLCQLPSEALSFSPKRFTPDVVRDAARKMAESPVVVDTLPRTGRRYIVVGGAGFLGGWMVLHLLQRGEDPRRIRIIDIRAPSRPDLKKGEAQKVAFYQADISDAAAVEAAFKAPWPPCDADAGQPEPEITVFNSAASIRFYERHTALVPRSAKVNLDGVQNVVKAACSVGATVLIYTSSGSVAVHRSRFWLWPWEKQPKYFVQVLNDDDSIVPKRHEQFFSNYAATKIRGERAVRAADKSAAAGQKTLRTGCIRPGNGIFGPGGDILCGAYLVRRDNPTWVNHILQSFSYVENCSQAHLCYERRLIDLHQGSSNPDIGGQAFTITDTGPPVTFGDCYTALTTLSPDPVFPVFSPTAMLLLAHILEFIYLSRFFLSESSSQLMRFFARFIPNITGDIINLQPSLFALTSIHLVFDDSRARLPPAKGGLGYNGCFTSLQGLCKTVDEHIKAGESGEERSLSGGISFGFGLTKASRGVDKVQKKVSEQLQLDAVGALN
ncbi:hypothetical protein SERLA73DRAFT_175136 [Serpula lacrymans var. lacrymans S7.3]|uniref:3-beta hydroxysteroid dehydrogenase/isomerase domain-containing protein n=2 Tax=Serpula lacrymans var. lacrymans TaxID=341189 RepID=F8PKP7_SERL3|nr:uncharacterized protein SERLADRAFT_457128 [Serpula lacrymans var. lacrymans S7.9]EGO03594.1 hypothetical protein SERLA73DRAFT_175136 [Serpula lacrymans var. lacrymans S7.3]EGO29414.1 hypothetical protein SERLADRAFT_457128 [Serpula lacrymans var. lacrymans S7.9]